MAMKNLDQFMQEMSDSEDSDNGGGDNGEPKASA